MTADRGWLTLEEVERIIPLIEEAKSFMRMNAEEKGEAA